MELYGKGLLGSLVLISGSSTTAIWVGGSTWNKNNPVAKTWLSDNHFSTRNQGQIADFTSTSNQNFFALGCHKFLFGGKNFKKLYTEANLTGTKGTENNSDKSSLPISDLFQDDNEPLLGCSTAYLMEDQTTTPRKKVYQYELALRQGDKGFEERISIHSDKIISQLVFYKKKQQDDLSQKPEYEHIFGLYRYINQNQITSGQKTYKVANPNPTDSFVEKWSELDLGNAKETQPRYYSVWVDDTQGDGIFDNLGVRSNNKPFSSVAKEQNNSDNKTSDFVYVKSESNGNDLKIPSGTLTHYDLSVLDSLVNSINSRKGFWKPSKEFCSDEISEGGRRPLLEIKRLSQYCYEIKGKAVTKSKSP